MVNCVYESEGIVVLRQEFNGRSYYQILLSGKGKKYVARITGATKAAMTRKFLEAPTHKIDRTGVYEVVIEDHKEYLIIDFDPRSTEQVSRIKPDCSLSDEDVARETIMYADRNWPELL